MRLLDFYKNIQISPTCWTWIGCKNRAGYGICSGKFRFGTALAHRVSYMMTISDIAPKMVLDHLCRNAACVNPAHLEQVTNAENVRRGNSPTNTNRDKQACYRGHSFTGVNLYTWHGKRKCKRCRYLNSLRKGLIDRLTVVEDGMVIGTVAS